MYNNNDEVTIIEMIIAGLSVVFFAVLLNKFGG